MADNEDSENSGSDQGSKGTGAATAGDGVKELESFLKSMNACTRGSNVKSVSDLSGHWSEEAVLELVDRGIIKGYEDGNFRPDKQISRAEFAALLLRLLCVDVSEFKTDFEDVNSSSWYYEYIAAAQYYGLIEGYEGNVFKPENVISRQEMATVVARLLVNGNIVKLPTYEETAVLINRYEDWNLVPEWSSYNVALMIATELLQGDSKGNINPLKPSTRAEVSTLFERLLGIIK